MTPEMTDIDGIGDARSETMKANGYDDVSAVADADPSELASKIPRVTEDRATNFVLEAENLLADSDSSDEATESEEDVLGPLSDESSDNDSDESSESSEDTSEEIVTTDDAIVSDDEESSSASSQETSEDSDDVSDSDNVDTVTVEIERDDERVEEEVVTALVEARRHYSNRNPSRSRQCEDLLEQYRKTGLSFELTDDQLNVFHAAIKNRENTYKGNSQLERMRVLMSIREQLQQFR